MTLHGQLQKLGVDLASWIEQLDAPAALVDEHGVVVWQNDAGVAFVGDQRGVDFSSIAPDYLRQAKAAYNRRLASRDAVTSSSLVLIDAAGRRRRVETVSIAVKDGGRIVGVLGIVKRILGSPGNGAEKQLTPRQQETLRLLGEGLSTEEIAGALGVSRETARNYIRRLLQVLGVHSRLEAVVHAREIGLL